MKLWSERTLRDYTNFFQSKVGFQAKVDKMRGQAERVTRMEEICRLTTRDKIE